MASSPPSPPIANLQQVAHPSDPAIFELSKPVKVICEGAEVEVDGLDMRPLQTFDLPLLDLHRGNAIALAQSLISALCGITAEQVLQLDLEDFAMLSTDGLWQVEQLSVAMGLAPDFFLGRAPAGNAVA